MSRQPQTFAVGDRVVVHGGYDMDPDWLLGGDGYTGTIRELTPQTAAVELDDKLELEGPDGRRWQDFGCELAPDLDAIPSGGGIGYWVESHATIAPVADPAS